MRKVRYSVAASLDGYIAGPNGEADWIIMDPEIDFGALFSQFDTVFVGRKTFAGMPQGDGSGMKTYVFSRTLRPADHPHVTIVADKVVETVKAVKSAAGKDIWLFGGGELFRSLAQEGLVDTLELAVIPVLLGGGIPLYPVPADQLKLKLTAHKIYKTGIVGLTYQLV